MKQKNINIGIDASFIHGERTGSSMYVFQLINNLATLDKDSLYTIFPFFSYIFNDNYHTLELNLPNNFEYFWKNYPRVFTSFFWKRMKIVPWFLMKKYDVFHATTFTIPPSHMYRKLVVTIYDVSFYTHPQFHLKQNIDHCMQGTLEAVRRADKIIAISQSTKNDLIKYFDCDPAKIIVMYLGCDHVRTEMVTTGKNGILQNHGISKKYVFHLGSLEPRKNTLGLIKAFHFAPQWVRDDYNLVIGGARGWLNSDIMSYVTKHHLGDCIKFVGYISEDDLPYYYYNAKLFVYPSFYEGFGIPPLEAMTLGCPVLTSNTSSMPEVCGNGAMYCDPHDVEDISSKITLLLTQDNSQLITTAMKRASKYRWIKAAKETLEIYKMVSA